MNNYKYLVRKEKWFDKECEKARAKSFEALYNLRKTNSHKSKNNYLIKNFEFKNMCEKNCHEYYLNLEVKLDKVRDSKEWRDIVREIKGLSNRCKSVIRRFHNFIVSVYSIFLFPLQTFNMQNPLLQIISFRL